jgi:hypothetical protein
MADHFRLTYYLFCSAEEAERLYTEAGDNLFCDCDTHLGGFANPDHMTRVHEPCRHQVSTFSPVRDDDEVFLELTVDEARALAGLLAPCTDPELRSAADQLARELATRADVQTRLVQ